MHLTPHERLGLKAAHRETYEKLLSLRALFEWRESRSPHARLAQLRAADVRWRHSRPVEPGAG